MAEQDKIQLDIVTPERVVLSTMVEKLTVPGLVGSTGILCNHAPMITALVPGVLCYTKDGKPGYAAVSRGFFEIRDNKAEILVEAGETAEEIDYQRALSARERAEKRLEIHGADVDEDRAKGSLARATARVKAYELAHGK